MRINSFKILIFMALLIQIGAAHALAKDDDWGQIENNQSTIQDADAQWKVLDREGNVNSANDLPDADAAESGNSVQANAVKSK